MSKIVFTYNSFLADLLLLAKKISPKIRQAIKEHYSAIDRRDPNHVAYGAANMPLSKLAIASSESKEEIDFPIIDGLTFGEIVHHKAVDEAASMGMLRLVYVMAATVRLHQMDSDAKELTELLELVMRIQAVGKWGGWPEPAPDIAGLEDSISKTTDDCIKGILSHLLELCSVKTSGVNDTENDDDDSENTRAAKYETPPALQETLTKLQSSKIGSLAREIAEEIDFSSVDQENPQEWLNLNNISNPNSFIGGVVEKLSTKLSHKMQSGDLKQEDLLTDAFSLLQSMGMSGPSSSGGSEMGGSGLPNFDLASMMSSLTSLTSQAPHRNNSFPRTKSGRR